MYSVEGLERGIEACKKNIKTFEDAIDKERATIKEYRKMIDVIETKEVMSKPMKVELGNDNKNGRIVRLEQ
jgi:hypothetical protein